MTTIQHNALHRQTRSMDAWWSAPLSNLAATWTNWFPDRLKKIKPAIKTSRKVFNGPYVHNKLSYVFFPSFSLGHPSYLHWRVTGHANVTAFVMLFCSFETLATSSKRILSDFTCIYTPGLNETICLFNNTFQSRSSYQASIPFVLLNKQIFK